MSFEVYSISAPVDTDFPSKFRSKKLISDAFYLALLDLALILRGAGRPGGFRGFDVLKFTFRDRRSVKFWGLSALGMLYLCNKS